MCFEICQESEQQKIAPGTKFLRLLGSLCARAHPENLNKFSDKEDNIREENIKMWLKISNVWCYPSKYILIPVCGHLPTSLQLHLSGSTTSDSTFHLSIHINNSFDCKSTWRTDVWWQCKVHWVKLIVGRPSSLSQPWTEPVLWRHWGGRCSIETSNSRHKRNKNSFRRQSFKLFYKSIMK